MKNIPPLNVHTILKQYGLRADKKLGQNFLHDDSALIKICETAEISDSDSVLEIGPGLGSLTRYLAASSADLTVVELDPDLLPPLKWILKPYPHVKIIHGDILKLNIADIIKKQNYIVAANIPYNITSAIIRHLLESEIKPKRIVLTIQKEVAQRICEEPGDLSLLALSVQVYGKPSLQAVIPAESFHPIPKVDSAILRIDIYDEPLIEKELLDTFFKLIKAGFSQKRKMLRNSLASGLHISSQVVDELLESANIESKRRAEALSIAEWQRLCRQWNQKA
ncbi:MAG: dimethyladenosine transferase [Chloroflexi bacterium OLB14]|nr:MAG: dimethyladenosine transferase [Chloroflexi bacterium OLB14]